jgi:lysophospholipase-1
LYPAWFDTPTLNFLDPETDDISNQNKAVTYLLSIVESEKRKGVKVFIGGYSQGATIALLALLTGGVKVDGLVILRGWVARGQSISQVSPVCFFSFQAEADQVRS